MFNNKLKNIDINKIQANENQPRTVFNEEKIEELAASIKENGLIQPIVVRKVNGIYQIIAGERRYRACCSLNMKQVPCIIEDYDDKQTQTLAIIENIQREDLSPLEEAKAYQALIKEYGYSQTELADIVGKKQSTIANKLRLLKLSDDVKFSLNQKQITERHARAMLSLNEEKQQEMEDITVAKIEHGSMKAQLVLANGKKVDLRPETNLQLEEVGGTRILTSDNRVKYSGKDSLAGQPAEVKYNTLIVPRGGEFSLELADGTRVWLNAESRLRYPVVFMGEERKVEMEGEVYFEVAKNREKPFIVTVNGVDIRVLGTSFNVSAYQEEVVTTLVEGKVQLKRGDEQVVLSPNQQAIWSDDKFKVKQVDARNYVLWKEGIFYFEDVDLERILDDMARWYNVNIFYMNSTLKKMKFSVEIKRYEDINEILRRIEQTKRVKFEIKDRTINVYE